VSDAPAWVQRARELGPKDALAAGWERIGAGLPPVLEGDGVRGLLAPLVAAVAWAGASFRELAVAEDPAGSPALDPFALFMRLLAFGLSVRALVLAGELVRRLTIAARRRAARLVLAPEGLFVAAGGAEAWLERDDVVAVIEPSAWQGRRGGRRWAEVLVVPRSAAVGGTSAAYLAIPPLFLETPGVLAEHLSRWRGSVEEPEAPSFPEPETLGSKVFDDAARGILALGSIAVKHGNGWLRAGPYASLFLLVVAADGYLRASAMEREALGPWPLLVVGGVALLVPLGWIALTRREIAVRKGLAMVLTPAEVLLRTRAGVLRTRWSSLVRTALDRKTSWSILEGLHQRKVLVLKRKNAEPIFYDEAFLGVPAEVAQAWLEAARRGAALGAMGGGAHAGAASAARIESAGTTLERSPS
jgi:hypothetical protein